MSDLNRLVIDRKSDRLISDQIFDWLLDLIQTWDIEKPLPSQTWIMQEFGVSLASVNTAFKRLVDDGLIERHRGRGSFISRSDVRQYSAELPRKKRPKVIVISLDYFSETIWTNIHLCDEFLDRAGYQSVHLKLKKSEDISSLQNLLKIEKGVVGIVLAAGTRFLYSGNEYLNRLEMPVVMMEPVKDISQLNDVYSVHPDYEQSGFLMADELLKRNHEKIAYIGEIPAGEVSEAHENGIRRAFKQHKKGVRSLITMDERPQPWQYAAEMGYHLTAKLLREHPDVQGVIYDCGVGAFGGVRALREAGKRIPEDVSVIGEGDYQYLRFCSPPLTVTNFDIRERARLSIECITQPDANRPREMVVTPMLIERDSVMGR